MQLKPFMLDMWFDAHRQDAEFDLAEDPAAEGAAPTLDRSAVGRDTEMPGT